jgi:hypothetical protein
MVVLLFFLPYILLTNVNCDKSNLSLRCFPTIWPHLSVCDLGVQEQSLSKRPIV